MNRKLLIWLLVPVLLGLVGGPTRLSAQLIAETRADIERAMKKGVEFLNTHQKDDGSWENHPGITGLVCLALINDPTNPSARRSDRVRTGLSYLAKLAKPDGAIFEQDVPNYNTAVAMQALVASGDPAYRDLIKKAQEFLVVEQADETEGYTKDDKFYGGVGYGSDLRPDLANLEMALHALKDSDLPENHPLWEKAIVFIQRSQNHSETNDQAWAGNDGGFVYYPGFTYATAGGTHSYGSMTYAGLMSYSYANLRKEDPRVQAALRWIRENYTVDENPGMGMKTLYYYYMVFAKALNTYGDEQFVDSRGTEHRWREDLGRKLVSLQHQEGYWVNEDPAWWQDNQVLVTAFTLLSLEEVMKGPSEP